MYTPLQKEKACVEEAIQPIRNSCKTPGVSIVSHVWKDTKNQPLINVIAVSPKGQCLLRQLIVKGKLKIHN